jgi:hypothetical protein
MLASEDRSSSGPIFARSERRVAVGEHVIGRQRLPEVALVYQCDLDFVDSAACGDMPLDAASSQEPVLGQLRAAASDLADLVSEERMPLLKAQAANGSASSRNRCLAPSTLLDLVAVGARSPEQIADTARRRCPRRSRRLQLQCGPGLRDADDHRSLRAKLTWRASPTTRAAGT